MVREVGIQKLRAVSQVDGRLRPEDVDDFDGIRA